MPHTHPLPGALREFARLAAQLLGGDVAWPIRVTLKDRCGTAHRLYLEAPASGTEPDTEPDTGASPARSQETRPDPQHHLTPMTADCLEAADATWRSSADLAQRAGWSYYARWRGAVGKLVKAGYLERHPVTKKVRVTEAGRVRLLNHRAEEAGEE